MAARESKSEKMARIISEQLAAVLPGLVAQLTQNINDNNNNNNNNDNNNNNNNNENSAPPFCTYKHFKTCDPEKFTGEDGAVSMLQWFESIENTFIHSKCPDELRVEYASGMLRNSALTWWNGEQRQRGAEEAVALPWSQFKAIMSRRFCPRSEIKKLEHEIQNIKQDSGESEAYTKRFYELSLLCPDIVTSVTKQIELYTDGLPPQIQDSVVSVYPVSMEAAVRLASTLTENHVKAGTLFRKGVKKNTTTEVVKTEAGSSAPVVTTTPGESSSAQRNRKRKARNFAATAPTMPAAPVPINQVPVQKRESRAESISRISTTVYTVF